MSRSSPSFRSVLKQKNFTIFAIAQMISQFGDRLNNMALIGLIGAKAAGSPFAFSQVAVFAALPVVVFGPLSGILVDRLNRKWVLVSVDAGRTLIVFLIPTLFYMTGNLLLVNLAIFSIFLLGLLFNSAKMSILPNLVRDKNEYMMANAVANFIGRFATFLGLLLGGFIVDLFLWKQMGWDGWRAGFYIDATTYLLSAIFLATLALPRMAVKPREAENHRRLLKNEASVFRGSWDDLMAAVQLIRRRRLIRMVYGAVGLTVFFMGAAYSLDIMIAQQVFGFGTKGVGILGSLLGVGLILGALSVGKWGKRIGEFRMLSWSILALGVLLGISAFTKEFKLFAAMTLVAGFFLSALMITEDTLFHRMVPASFRGRIFSAKELMWGGGFMLTTVLLGSLGEFLKIFMSYHVALQSMLVASSLFMVVSVVVYALINRNRSR